MPTMGRTTGFVGLAAGLGVILTAVIPGVSQLPPAVITTDTEQYCRHLSEKLTELVQVAPRPPETEVVALAGEGKRLCDAGQIRGGISRLRHGVMLMMRDFDQRGEP
jgi:hypothetical protein